MTTLNYTEGTLYGPVYKAELKDGVDGKYYVDATGKQVIKWNDYSRTHVDNSSVISAKGFYIAGGMFPENSKLIRPLTHLQSKLVNRIRGHSFNMGVALGESRQTINMVLDNVKAIGLAARDVKHGQFSDALRRLGSQYDVNDFLGRRPNKLKGLKGGVLGNTKSLKPLDTKDFANRWLEIQYGWKPLLNDVYEASKAFKALEGPRTLQVVVTTNDHGTYEASQSPSLYKCPGNWRVKQKLIYEFREDISVSRSLGLDDPLSVIWELMPYSFVVDWFLPIGTFLDNLAMIPKLKGRSIHTKFIKSDFRGVGVLVPPNNTSYVGASTRGSSMRLVRTVSSMGVPIAYPEFKPLEKVFTGAHLRNALALARQHFK